MADRRTRRRQKLITLLGGVCVRCGAADDLDFDHVEPGSQEFRISGRGLDKPWPVILIEVAKCQLLCKPCHRVKSKECGETGGGSNKIDGPGGFAHGTEPGYMRGGCRCGDCCTARHDARVRRGEIKSGGKRYSGPGRYGTVEHGGGLTGKNRCACSMCKAKKAEYARNRRSRMVKLGITGDR
jgi:hypothetical protein